MKNKIFFVCVLILVSCSTSNTIYKEPKNLIPKDSMVALLTDMYIASSINTIKNKFLEKEKNYVFLVYEKYKIDSARFRISNIYYTSRTEEYTIMLKQVKFKLDSLETVYIEKRKLKDSLIEKHPNKKLLNKEGLNKKLSLVKLKKKNKRPTFK